MNGNMILWAAVFVVMVVVELCSMQLVSVWFAAGAAAAFVMALLDFGMGMQLFVFILVSALLLCLTRPLLKKFKVDNTQPTNLDLDIGKTATVIEDINNALDTGRAKLNGVDWKAVSVDDTVIESGKIVKVESIKGTKLFVSLYIEEKSEMV